MFLSKWLSRKTFGTLFRKSRSATHTVCSVIDHTPLCLSVVKLSFLFGAENRKYEVPGIYNGRILCFDMATGRGTSHHAILAPPVCPLTPYARAHRFVVRNFNDHLTNYIITREEGLQRGRSAIPKLKCCEKV